ncbi:S-adenosylmethionine-dependent methyltransferase [Actinidia chinensis var. chinensis]|uniref:S-adenosylmethionine-dependent methyltransferase n=1 Tax=Actinidia chinensis var. chinensis TaxID=1590841 RepID=A0A2R6RKQ2_ACTCC|nr:S-adenosylmethionine-dependent methyltransferase [Actinidia chinensis var. chinensis]
MNGGNGPHSYTQNSTFQKNMVDVAKELIDELIDENLDIENPSFDCSNPVWIADLGCSVGPYTFFAVQGRISHTGMDKAIEAYSGQFRKDMENFLNTRALELVNGGMMIVLTLLLPNGVLYSETTLGMGEECVRRERTHSTCLSILCRWGELKELIVANGYFQIVRIEKLDYPMGDEKNRDPRLCARHFRAVIDGVVEDHFGKEIVEFFDRLTKKLEGNMFIFDEKHCQEAQYLVFLRRRGHRLILHLKFLL